MRVLEASMGLRDTEDDEEFLQQNHQPNDYKLKPYQQAQARLSTGAGGLGLASAVTRRFSASLGNLIGTLPEGIASLRGPLGEWVKDKISERVLVERMREAINQLHHEHRVSEEGLKGVLPLSWVAWALHRTAGRNGRR